MNKTDDELWSAIADPSRRRILDSLLANDNATQSEVAEEMPFTRQAVAKHLAVLEHSGLVTIHRQGREVRYVVQREQIDRALRLMAEMANRWDERLSKLKRMAETTHRSSKHKD